MFSLEQPLKTIGFFWTVLKFIFKYFSTLYMTKIITMKLLHKKTNFLTQF